MNQKKTIVIGFLGTTLDKGPLSSKRWEIWRPTIGLCQQQDFHIDRLELIYPHKVAALADRIHEDIVTISPKTEFRPNLIEIKDPWDFEEVYSALLDLAQGYDWNQEKEEYFLHITTGTHVAQICMFLLAEAHYFPAKLIQTSPALRAEKNFAGAYRIIDLDLSKYDGIASRFHKAVKDDLSFLKSGIATKNQKFNALIERIEKVAISSNEPILLLGPTGSGKSRLARRIYELKKVRHQITGNFVDVNCATIGGDGAMSALFGHLKGAFTGAAGSREGYLLCANQGIIFLDEIGELGIDEQAMLLRAVEEKTFFPVGSDKEVKSDFQLIAGTNRDLHALSRQGLFREDLLARINLWSFKLPGLRERVEDIAPNLDYELARYSEKHNRHISFNKEAYELFLKFAVSPQALWSSNFRDLTAAVTRMAILAESGRITCAIAAEEIQRLTENWSTVTDNHEYSDLCHHFGLQEDQIERLDRFDRVQLMDVLHVCKDSHSLAEAGRQLFSNSRQGKPNYNDADRLRKYLARFQVAWKGRAQRVSSST